MTDPTTVVKFSIRHKAGLTGLDGLTQAPIHSTLASIREGKIQYVSSLFKKANGIPTGRTARDASPQYHLLWKL